MGSSENAQAQATSSSKAYLTEVVLPMEQGLLVAPQLISLPEDEIDTILQVDRCCARDTKLSEKHLQLICWVDICPPAHHTQQYCVATPLHCPLCSVTAWWAESCYQSAHGRRRMPVWSDLVVVT